MPKKERKKGMLNLDKLKTHPALSQKLSFGQKASDSLTKSMGSWKFIIIFLIIMGIWIALNAVILLSYFSITPWDPYPFQLLNVILSTLAAIQAPIILMSQNREAEKDRVRSEYDYTVNRKAEREIQEIKETLRKIESKLKR